MSGERSTVEVLRAARERISDPERWAQHFHATDSTGAEVDDAESPAACKWCAFGAIYAEGLDPYEGPGTEASDLLEQAVGEWPPLVNDKRGHEAVLDMYDRAIELAEAQDA